MYELGEFYFLVGILVDSEQVPEDIVQFFFSSFLQNFNNEFSEFSIVQKVFLSCIILIKVDSELIPNGLDECHFFFWDSSWVRVFIFLGFGFEINVISKIFLDEVSKLLEGDESIFIGIKFIEDEDKIFSQRFESDEIASLSDETDELFKWNLFGGPDFAVGGLVSSVEEDFDEVDWEDDGNELFEGDAIVLSLQEGEVVVDNVVDLVLVESKDMEQDLFNLIQLEDLILVGIIFEEDDS